MPQKLGETSAKILKELEELMKYYKPTECFRSGLKVECYEVASELLRRGFSEDSLRICNRRRDLCLSLAKNSSVSVAEVSGAEVYPQVDVGDFVKSGDLLAYVVTGKGEVRSIRSSLEGYVVLVHEDPLSRPLKYFIIVAREGVTAGGDREN